MHGCVVAIIDPILRAITIQERFFLIVIHTIPIALAIILFNHLFFKSAEGIDGALNG